ncbi:MAG: elongation factor Ts, partial [Candidatus Baltobacteraceae bacterium]
MTTVMTYKPNAAEIKKLREETQAPMMDCSKALVAAQGDFQKAKKALIERGQANLEKKAERAANEGMVTSYIHAGGKIGVLVEV